MVALMTRQGCAVPALYNHRAQFARSARLTATPPAGSVSAAGAKRWAANYR